jgi:hypothetical protein
VSEWTQIADAEGPDMALAWPEQWRDRNSVVEQIRVEIAFPPETRSATLERVLLYPAARSRTSP